MRGKAGLIRARRALPTSIPIAGVAILACLLVIGPTGASGETGTSGTGAEPANCPASNPPNQVTLVAGTPQTTTLDTAFATGLQVALTNSDGCAVTGAAGVAVTFSAPSSGASGVFSGSGSNSVTVGSDSTGAVTATTFTANGIAGSYTLTADSQYGSVSFSLANTATGIPARIVALSPTSSRAPVSSRYARPLRVKVLDAGGAPVIGATVAFTLGTAGTTRCGESATAGAGFAAGATEATATTNAGGVAKSPSFTANGATGTFIATATVSSPSSSNGTGGEPGSNGTSGEPIAETSTATGDTTPVSFRLSNIAGRPVRLTAGVGSRQSAPVGGRFPIPLAVTVTDAEENPVPGALVAFSAPGGGPGGRFLIHPRGRRRHHGRTSRRRVDVKTDSCGIAVAPAFTANDHPGGYIVRATARHARPAAFALLNRRRQAP
jgi:hypothetical protein